MDGSNYLGTEITGGASGPADRSLLSAVLMTTALAIIVPLTLLALDRMGIVLPVVDELTMTVVR